MYRNIKFILGMTCMHACGNHLNRSIILNIRHIVKTMRISREQTLWCLNVFVYVSVQAQSIHLNKLSIEWYKSFKTNSCNIFDFSTNIYAIVCKFNVSRKYFQCNLMYCDMNVTYFIRNLWILSNDYLLKCMFWSTYT